MYLLMFIVIIIKQHSLVTNTRSRWVDMSYDSQTMLQSKLISYKIKKSWSHEFNITLEVCKVHIFTSSWKNT